jgi:type III pantothenate kinase
VIGANTVASIQSGLFFGYLGLLDGIIDRLLAEMGQETKVVAAGGLAVLIGEHSKHIKTVDDLLSSMAYASCGSAISLRGSKRDHRGLGL